MHPLAWADGGVGEAEPFNGSYSCSNSNSNVPAIDHDGTDTLSRIKVCSEAEPANDVESVGSCFKTVAVAETKRDGRAMIREGGWTVEMERERGPGRGPTSNGSRTVVAAAAAAVKSPCQCNAE